MSDFNLSESVGERIRIFRKNANMSQQQLADRIHKSKSTLSKYESGKISIDVDSLYEIADALEVDIHQFIDTPERSDRVATERRAFGGAENLYIYYYDGRTNRIVKTLIQVKGGKADSGNDICYCYMDCPSFTEHVRCKYFYSGIIEHFEMFTYIYLDSRSNANEKINMTILNPFHHQETWGLMLGISFNPISPFANKFKLSTTELPDSAIRPEDLELSRKELKMIRNNNMLILNTIEP